MSATKPSGFLPHGLKFGLKTLLIGVAVAAVFMALGVHWQDRWKKAEAARVALLMLDFRGSFDPLPIDRYFEKSCMLCIAECAVPLADRAAICEEHLGRMEEKHLKGHTMLFSSPQNMKEHFDVTLTYVRKTEPWVQARRPLSHPEQANNLSASALVPHGRTFDHILLAAIFCLGCLGIGRLIVMYARGVKVFAVDRQRNVGQMLRDCVLLFALLSHFYLALAYSWPLPEGLIPPWLSSHVVDTTAVKIVGSLLLACGLQIYTWGVQTMGRSWRLGIDRQTRDELVTGGIFRWSRNPIYVSLELLTVGAMLVQGRLIFFVLATVIVLLIHDQILREERFLAETYGEAYRDYRSSVGRYVSWPG